MRICIYIQQTTVQDNIKKDTRGFNRSNNIAKEKIHGKPNILVSAIELIKNSSSNYTRNYYKNCMSRNNETQQHHMLRTI